MHRNDYALIGIAVVASLLILIPVGVGLAEAQLVVNATIPITYNNGTTFEQPAFTNSTGTFLVSDYVEPYVAPPAPEPFVEPEPFVPVPILPTGSVSVSEYIFPTYPDEYYLYDGFIEQLAKRTVIGNNYNSVEDYTTGEGTWTSTIEKIQDGYTTRTDGTGVPTWKNYVLEQSGQKVIFNSNSIGGLIYDLPTCSYSIKEGGYNGNTVIPSVSAVATGLVNGEWVNLDVNNSLCDVNITSNADGIVITSTKSIQLDPISVVNTVNGTTTLVPQSETFTQVLEVDSQSGIKETWKVWKTDDTPLGISQTIHSGAQIEIAGQTIDIEALNGQSFDRQYIVENEAEILAITDSVSYDFDEGIDSLTGINIIYDSDYKVNLDYADGDFVGYLEIDPSFSTTWATQQKLQTDGSTMDTNDCNISGSHYPSWNTSIESEMAYLSHEGNGNGVCAMPVYEFDISSIPDTNTIIDVVMKYDLITVGSESALLTGFDWINSDEQIATTSGVDLQTQYLEMKSNIQYVQMDKTLGTNILADLGTTGDSDLQNSLSQDFFTTAIRLEPFDNHPTSSWQLIFENVELQVSYPVPAIMADPPTNVVATDGLPIGMSWTAPTNFGSDTYGVAFTGVDGYGVARTTSSNSLVELPDNSGTNAGLDFTDNEFLLHGFESVTSTNSLNEDFSSNSAWTQTGSDITITGGQVTWIGDRATTSDGLHHDLGNVISDDWDLEFDLILDSYSAGTAGYTHQFGVMLTDVDSTVGTYGSDATRDYVGAKIVWRTDTASQQRMIRAMDDNGSTQTWADNTPFNVADDQTAQGFPTAGTTYHIELNRSGTDYTVKIYDSTGTTLLDTLTGTADSSGLRYILIQKYNGGTDGNPNFDGKVDNLVFTDNVSVTTSSLSDKSTNSVAINSLITVIGIEEQPNSDTAGATAGGGVRPSRTAIAFDSAHSAIGSEITKFCMDLANVSTSGTGYLKAWDSTGTELKEFGSFAVSSLVAGGGTSGGQVCFDTSGYTLSADDRLGLEFTGGGTSNYVQPFLSSVASEQVSNTLVSDWITSWASYASWQSTYELVYTLEWGSGATSTTGTIGTALQNPNISYTDSNLPDNTDVLSVGGYVKLDGGFNLIQSSAVPTSFDTTIGIVDVKFSADGTKAYLSDGGQDASSPSLYTIYQYPLATAWDLSTMGSATISTSLGNAYDYNPTGIFPKSDGTKFFIAGNQNDSIAQWDDSGTAWTFGSGASMDMNTGGNSLDPFDTEVQDIFIGDSGTKLYITGTSSDKVHRFDLSSAWTMPTDGTALNALTHTEYSVSTNNINPTSLWFTNNGKIMLIGSGSSVGKYELATAWQINSGVTFIETYDVSATETNVQAVTLGNGESELFIGGTSSNKIHKFDFAPANTKLLGLNDVTFNVGATSASVTEYSGLTADVTWDSSTALGMSITGNTATKNVASGWYSGMARSVETFTPADNISVEFETTWSNNYIGFGQDPFNSATKTWQDLEFGMSESNIPESGSSLTPNVQSFQRTTTAGETMKISMSPSGVVTYYLNDVLVHTSTKTASGTYYVETAIYDINHGTTSSFVATVDNTIISATGLTDNTVTPQHYSFTRDASNLWTIYQNGVSQTTATDSTSLGANVGGVSWDTATAVDTSVSGDLLTGTGSGSWTTTIKSSDTFAHTTGSTVEFSTDTTGSGTSRYIVGFGSGSHTATTDTIESVDYGIFLDSTSAIHVYESATQVYYTTSAPAPHSNSDTYKVVMDVNGVVKYYENDVLFYTSTNSASGTYYYQMAMAGDSIVDVTVVIPAPYTTNLSGSLDEFFINSDTLTASEISGMSSRGVDSWSILANPNDYVLAQTELPNSSGSDSELIFTDNEFLLHGFELPQYKVHSFTTTGGSTFEITAGSGDVEYLVVAGGGAGGGYNGGAGGGGAGGYRTGTLSLSTSTGTSGSHTITVGDGGILSTAHESMGANGNDSIFSTITSTGGGGGADLNGGNGKRGANGGSGGGASTSSQPSPANVANNDIGGDGNTPSTTPSQGNNGGDGRNGYYFSGGGGGAGSVGGTATSSSAGAGGDGISNSISGTATFYAGGGGGGINGGSGAGAGGSGIGGNSAHYDGATTASVATINTGSGGGGGGAGSANHPSSGSSGIVIVRYLNDGSITATGGTEIIAYGTAILPDKSTNSVAVNYPSTITSPNSSNDATQSGSFSTGATGIDGNAWQFNGGKVITSHQLLPVSSDYTISTWINLDTLANTDEFVRSFGGAYEVWRNSSGLNYAGTSGTVLFEPASSIATGTWYNIVLVHSASGDVAYLNGVEKSTSPIASVPTVTEWYLGGRDNNNEPLDGRMDQTSVWSVALSPSEVASLYSSPATLPIGLLSNYGFEDTGSTLADTGATHASPPPTSTTGSIGTALQNPNLSYADSNLPDNTDVLSVGGYVKLDTSSITETSNNVNDVAHFEGTIGANYVIGEQITSGNALIGKTIDSLSFWLYKLNSGTSGTETFTFGVWDSSGALVHNFGTVTRGEIPQGLAFGDAVKFTKSTGTYVLQTNDILGARTDTNPNTAWTVEITQRDTDVYSDGQRAIFTQGATPVTSTKDIAFEVAYLTAPANIKLLGLNDISFNVGTTTASVTGAPVYVTTSTITQSSTNEWTAVSGLVTGITSCSGEVFTTASTLNGETMNSFTFDISHEGGKTGDIIMGVFDESNCDIRSSFRTIDASTINSGYPSSSTSYTATGAHVLADGDLVGLKWINGQSSNIYFKSQNTDVYDTGAGITYNQEKGYKMDGQTNTANRDATFTITIGEEAVNTLFSATGLTDNTSTAQHYAFTRDASNLWSIYQNGVSQATATDSTSLGSNSVPLTWSSTGLVGYTLSNSNSDITRTGSNGWSVSKAQSSDIFTVGNGAFEVKWSGASESTMFGLNSGTLGYSEGSCPTACNPNDFAFYMVGSPTIYENLSGKYTGSAQTVSEYKITVSNSGVVKYFLDGVEVYESLTTASGDYFIQSNSYGALGTAQLLSTSSAPYTTNISGSLDEFFINSDTLTSTEIDGISKRGTTVSPYTTSSTSFNDNTVVAGNEYFYKVYSVTDAGYGVASNMDSAMTVSLANAPTGLTSSVNSNAHIILDWTASTDLGNGSLISMNIQRDDGTGWSTIATTSSTSPPYTDTTAVTSQTYDYRVASINEAGIGAYSNTVTATAGLPADAITNVVTTVPNTNTLPYDVQVTFPEPLSWGTGTAVSYDIYESATGTGAWTQVASEAYISGQFTTTVSISNGQPLTEYFYKVLAVSTHGTSADSNVDSVTTADVPAQPNAPTLAINDPDNAPLNISVTFANPSDGGSAINSWFVERWDATTTNWSTVVASTGTTDLVYPDNSVIANTEYKYRVSAINGIGTSIASSESTSITTPNVPDASTVTLAINDPNASPLVITATPVANGNGGSAIIDFNLEYSDDGSNWTQISTGLTGTFDQTVANAGTHYFKTQARNNVGTGVLGTAVTIDTPNVPDAPTVTLAILDPNNSPLEITATFVAGASGGSNIIDFNLEHSSDGVLYANIATGVTGTYAHTVSLAGTHYFQATARNNVGDSLMGTVSNIDTPTIPTPPQTLTATSLDNANIELNWTMPSSTGGSVLQSFSIQNDASGSFVQVATVAETATTYTHPSLDDATNYNYQVIAINNVGSSNPSNQANAWTMPDAPVGLTVNTISSNDSLELTWTQPTGTVTDYRVETALVSDGIFTTSQSPTFATSCSGVTCVITDTGLTSGSQHMFQIYASNLGGESTVSTNSTNWTLANVPTQLAVTLDPDYSSESYLSWTSPSGVTTGFQIDRESPSGGGWLPIEANTGLVNVYTDTGLTLSTDYNYRISSINLGGISVPSASVLTTTHSQPDPPTDITFDLQDIGSNLRVQISWVEPVNLQSGTLSGYMMERNDGTGWSFLANTGTSPAIIDTDIQRGVNYDYRVSATTQIATGSPSVSNSFEFVDGTFDLPLTAVQGNTMESQSSFTKTFGDPVSYATNILIVKHSADNSVITTVASDNNLILSNSTTIINGNKVGIELTSGVTQLDTQYVYETSVYTYTGYLTTVQDGVTHLFSSTNSTVTPLNPFGGDTFANEFRDELTYQTSTVELYAEPSGYDAVLRYQHQDPTIEPFFYGFENVQANNTSVSPVLDDKDFYVSVYVNPEKFDFVIDDPATGLAHIECNEDSPLNCPAWDAVYTPSGEVTHSLNPTYGAITDIPDGIPSDFVTKSFKSPDSPAGFGLEPLGDLFGMPMVFIFVIGLGAVFTGRSAQMGVIFIAVTIGIMLYMGYISFDFGTSGLSTAVTWGIIIVAMIGGILVGKRWS